MDTHVSDRFRAANQELQSFLQRADVRTNELDTIKEEELHRIWIRLVELGPTISRRETIAWDLQDEIESYVRNLRMLKKALEEVRSAILARRSHLETARQHLEGLQEFVYAYQRTV